MAYGDDIDALGPDHRWSFDNTLNDQVGSVNGTGTGTSFTTNPICEDVTYSLLSDAVGDRVSIPSTTDINNSAQERKAVAGWFMVTEIQPPPKNIYGEGNTSQAFRIILGWGNNLIFEVFASGLLLQIFGDTFLELDRAYHLCMIFEGNNYGNELRAYLDGVEQLSAVPADRQPDQASLPARGVAEFSDPAGTVSVGAVEVILNGLVDGRWNEWATWDGADAVLTDTEVREELFEKGVLPEYVIATDTEANMFLDMANYDFYDHGNHACTFEVQAVSGGGDFTLEMLFQTFDEKSSLHIKYTGTDTLTIDDYIGNVSKVATPNGGTVIIRQYYEILNTVRDVNTGAIIEGARVYIEAAAGGPLTAGTEIMSQLTNSIGQANSGLLYTAPQPFIGRVRKGSATPLYKTTNISGTIVAEDFVQTIYLVPDEE